MSIYIKIPGGFLFSVLVLTIISVKTFSQEIIKMDRLITAELNAKFRSLSRDAAFKLLEKDLSKKNFDKLQVDKTSYGFTTTYKDKSGKLFEGEFYTYDFYNKATNQMASIIWGNNGKSIYRAHIVFPPGEKDFKTAMEKGIEMYVDANNKLQKASSYGKCFIREVLLKCSGYCYQQAKRCEKRYAYLGLSTPAIFMACASDYCANCYFWASFGCLWEL